MLCGKKRWKRVTYGNGGVHSCSSTYMCVCVSKPSGCTAGSHFVFVVPSTLVESTVTPPLSLKASDASCTPQRVTHTDSSFSDVYTVPLHGCGVQK